MWNDWSYAHSDGTFGNRWDDPQSEYRVLYASTARLSCFMETIGRFPGDPQVKTGLDDIELEDGEVDHAVGPGELVVADWLPRRRIGSASVGGSFAAVGTSSSLAYLHTQVAHLLSDFGLEELDGGSIRSVRRQLTQRISRIVFECSTSDGRRKFDGIEYLSRYGDEFENWAIFEPGNIVPGQPKEIVAEDPDLVEAAQRLGVMLV
ncbi:MAG: RES domain-containing protein [Actinobacteria bacterium]|nr:RES domain-containing protein [Actinomycetota bacterium]